MERMITLADFKIYQGGPFFIIAGPCVIENEEVPLRVADFLAGIQERLDVNIIFKSSYDKANRTSIYSFRGPGLEKGLQILEKVKRESGLPVLSDVHRVSEVRTASSVLDIIQIPAFLCRQTDLIISAAETGLPLNLKKGQFLSPWDMKQVVEKAVSCGNNSLLLTERGASFGYNNLVFDPRSIPVMRSLGYPVVFDATHSVQLPGGRGTSSGGQRELAVYLARAAVGAGADGVFMEIHPDPDKALCDGPNSIPIDEVEDFIKILKEIYELVNSKSE